MRVGILGGGQLARMLALSGAPLGLRLLVMDTVADACAGQFAPLLVGDYRDEAALAEVERLVAQLPQGIGYEWAGQSLEEKAAGSTATVLFALSLLAVFLVLAALYESTSIPISVLLVVPLGVLGAVAFTMLRGMPNDVYFKVGLIAIIGLSAGSA